MPGRASTTASPALMLLAPQTIVTQLRSPSSTRQTRQAVGVRVLLHLVDARDDEALDQARDPAARIALDLEPPIVSRSATSSTRGSPSTNSREPTDTEARMAVASELAQEAQVAAVEEADVVDPVLAASRCARRRGRTRSRCTFLGIVSDAPRTRPDRPSRRRGSRASRCPCRRGSRAATEPRPAQTTQADVDLGARLGEREEARPQAHRRGRGRTCGAGTRSARPSGART